MAAAGIPAMARVPLRMKKVSPRRAHPGLLRFGRGGRLFGLRGGFLALDVGFPAFAFDGFVMLFAHIWLYFVESMRLCGAL
jgi:hypothetical protein